MSVRYAHTRDLAADFKQARMPAPAEVSIALCLDCRRGLSVASLRDATARLEPEQCGWCARPRVCENAAGMVRLKEPEA